MYRYKSSESNEVIHHAVSIDTDESLSLSKVTKKLDDLGGKGNLYNARAERKWILGLQNGEDGLQILRLGEANGVVQRV